MFVCDKCLDGYEGSAVEFAKARGPVSRGRCEDCGEPHACYELYSGSAGLRRKGPPTTTPSIDSTGKTIVIGGGDEPPAPASATEGKEG